MCIKDYLGASPATTRPQNSSLSYLHLDTQKFLSDCVPAFVWVRGVLRDFVLFIQVQRLLRQREKSQSLFLISTVIINAKCCNLLSNSLQIGQHYDQPNFYYVSFSFHSFLGSGRDFSFLIFKNNLHYISMSLFYQLRNVWKLSTTLVPKWCNYYAPMKTA